MGLIYNNSVLIPFDYKLPVDSELYHIMSTNPNDEKRKKFTVPSEKALPQRRDLTKGNFICSVQKQDRCTIIHFNPLGYVIL